MKPYLPYNLLLLLALLTCGFLVLYNFTIRDSFATTLRYEYPVVEQVEAEQRQKDDPPPEETERIRPEEWTEPVEDGQEEMEEEPLTRVQFPLNLNTATVEQLKFIPRVGEVMAQNIAQYRDHLGGRYDDLEQLRNIKGVGDKTFERLCTYLYIPEQEPQYAAAEDADDSGSQPAQ